MKRDGHVLFCSDDNGFSQLKVALYSLLKTAETDRSLKVHVFTAVNPLSEAHVADLQDLTARYPFATVEVVDVEALLDRYRSVFENPAARWCIMTWSRCFASEIKDAETIVYLDIDTFVCHDLSELYDLNMGDAVVAAVNEDARGDGRAEYYWNGGLAARESTRYFNASVLVMNVRVFREEHLLAKVADWYSAHRNEAIRLDQDTFNALFWDRTIRLHPKYNYTDGWCERHVKYARRAEHWRGNPPREILEAVVDPSIIHFWGPKKPWLWNHRPEGRRYERALRELGMLTGPLLGTTFARRVQSAFFVVYHAALRKLAKARI